MKIDALKKRYDKEYEWYKRLKEEVIYVLDKSLKEQRIPIHDIGGRIKELDSIISKMQRFDINDSFDKLNDICGVRIICLFLSDIKKINKLIEDSFEIITKDDKISSGPENQFGYMSIHFTATLPPKFKGPRYDDLKNLKFEIQLRTIAMHSWATISHYLDYKSPHSIPSHLRKDFNALSALFYLADSHFENFFNASEESKKVITKKTKNIADIKNEEINFDTLTAYLTTKYPNRNHNDDPGDISKLLEEIIMAGYAKITDLDLDLNKAQKAFISYEKKYLSGTSSKEWKLYDVGVVRISLSIVSDKYFESMKGNLPQPIINKYREFRPLLK